MELATGKRGEMSYCVKICPGCGRAVSWTLIHDDGGYECCACKNIVCKVAWDHICKLQNDADPEVIAAKELRAEQCSRVDLLRCLDVIIEDNAQQHRLPVFRYWLQKRILEEAK